MNIQSSSCNLRVDSDKKSLREYLDGGREKMGEEIGRISEEMDKLRRERDEFQILYNHVLNQYN
jgi:hypothetical protein